MISKEQVWIDKKTGGQVLVLYVMGFRLTYQDNGLLKTANVTDFLAQFEESGDE